MRIIPKKNAIHKSKLLYRKIRYRKGYGVHSPFVFNLITKVIEEKCPYYCYYDIELIRKQLLHKEDIILIPEISNPSNYRKYTIESIVKREAIRPKHGALLFRLTNYFKPKNILQIGPSIGLSTLYLTSYLSGLRCISLENIPEYESISQWVYNKGARTSVDLRIGEYTQLLPNILEEFNSLDFVYFNLRTEQTRTKWIIDECIKFVHNDTIFVIGNIKTNGYMRNVWKEICNHPETTVTVDLFSIGIVFFNKKLHKRNYIVYF